MLKKYDINSLINRLSKEERESFKEVIKESIDRQNDLEIIEKESLENIVKLENNLNEIIKILNSSKDKIEKIKDNIISTQVFLNKGNKKVLA